MHEASCNQALVVMQVRDLEMDQQLMQHDMEELSKQAQQAVELLRSALGAACKALHGSISCMTGLQDLTATCDLQSWAC